MKTAKQVMEMAEELKREGIPLSDAVWQTALACEGWPYVYGAWGEECDPQKRGRRISSKHPKTKDKCQVLNGTDGSCTGCKWYPNNERVLMNDCHGFTGSILEMFGIKISITGATSQWNGDYWEAKGEIKDIPDDILVCLFERQSDDPAKMSHTGFGYHGETVECQVGVEYFKKRNKKWTHWAIPRGIGSTPADYRPTLRKGDSGPYVTLAQTELINRGYDLGKWGADGKFGAATEKAVKKFQQDWDLKVDGIIGQETWGYLESTPVKITYVVTVPHMSQKDAEALTALYPGAYMKKED